MRTLILLSCAFAFGGCAFIEGAAKTGASIVLDTLEDKIPGMTDTIANAVESKVHEKIEKVVEVGRVKILAGVRKEMTRFHEINGVNLSLYDANDDGAYQLNEIKAAYGAMREENDRRKREGEESIPWTEYIRLAAIFAGVYATGSLGKGGIRKIMNGKKKAEA